MRTPNNSIDLILTHPFLITGSNGRGFKSGLQCKLFLSILSIRGPTYYVSGHSTTTWTEFCHFWPPHLCGQFLYPERGQKQTFFDPLPPHLVHVVIKWPLSMILPILPMTWSTNPLHTFFRNQKTCNSKPYS